MTQRSVIDASLEAPPGCNGLSRVRRGHLKRWLSVVVVGLVASGLLVVGNAAPAGAATSDQMSAARGAVQKAARKFLRNSGCPLTLQRAKAAGEITPSNRNKVVKRIIKHTLLAKGSPGACTGVLGIPSDTPASVRASYRSEVRSLATPGNLLIWLWWRDNTGKSHKTLAVVGKQAKLKSVVSKQAKLKFESLMASYTSPAPPGVPQLPTARTSASSTQLWPTIRDFSWTPWRAGSSCIAIDGMGRCTARKWVTLRVTSTDSKYITHSGADVTVKHSPLLNVMKHVGERIFVLDRVGVECIETTVTVSFSSMFLTWAGTDVQVYTLCADGRIYYDGISYTAQVG